MLRTSLSPPIAQNALNALLTRREEGKAFINALNFGKWSYCSITDSGRFVGWPFDSCEIGRQLYLLGDSGRRAGARSALCAPVERSVQLPTRNGGRGRDRRDVEGGRLMSDTRTACSRRSHHVAGRQKRHTDGPVVGLTAKVTGEWPSNSRGIEVFERRRTLDSAVRHEAPTR